MAFLIRPITADDISSIYQLVIELARFEKAEEQVTVELEYYQEQFAQGHFDALVLERDEHEIVGMALYYTAFSTWKGKMLYLEDFIVLPEHRSQGWGQKIFDELVHLCKREKYQLMKWQVLDWNEGAIKFYERNHATIQKEWYNGLLYFDD